MSRVITWLSVTVCMPLRRIGTLVGVGAGGGVDVGSGVQVERDLRVELDR